MVENKEEHLATNSPHCYPHTVLRDRFIISSHIESVAVHGEECAFSISLASINDMWECSHTDFTASEIGRKCDLKYVFLHSDPFRKLTAQVQSLILNCFFDLQDVLKDIFIFFSFASMWCSSTSYFFFFKPMTVKVMLYIWYKQIILSVKMPALPK